MNGQGNVMSPERGEEKTEQRDYGQGFYGIIYE